jgi:hypothetical protein
VGQSQRRLADELLDIENRVELKGNPIANVIRAGVVELQEARQQTLELQNVLGHTHANRHHEDAPHLDKPTMANHQRHAPAVRDKHFKPVGSITNGVEARAAKNEYKASATTGEALSSRTTQQFKKMFAAGLRKHKRDQSIGGRRHGSDNTRTKRARHDGALQRAPPAARDPLHSKASVARNGPQKPLPPIVNGDLQASSSPHDSSGAPVDHKAKREHATQAPLDAHHPNVGNSVAKTIAYAPPLKTLPVSPVPGQHWPLTEHHSHHSSSIRWLRAFFLVVVLPVIAFFIGFYWEQVSIALTLLEPLKKNMEPAHERLTAWFRGAHERLTAWLRGARERLPAWFCGAGDEPLTSWTSKWRSQCHSERDEGSTCVGGGESD